MFAAKRYRLLRRAFVASLAAHACVALFIPLWSPSISPGPNAVTTISFARIARVRIERRPVAPAAPSLARPVRFAPTVQIARQRSELTAKTHRRPVPTYSTSPGSAPKREAAPRVAQQTRAAMVAPTVTPPRDETRSVAVTPAPQATQAERAVAGTGASERGGVLPFGAEMPEPVLDPRVRRELVERFKVHVTLVVTVGDDGKTKNVKFDPPIDAHTERAIEDVLANANWDPAVCGGGIACEGSTKISL